MSIVSGRNFRSTNRGKRKSAIDRKTDELIASTLMIKGSNRIDEHRYEEQIRALFSQIEEIFPAMAQRTIAKNHVIRFVELGNTAGKWSLPVPSQTIKLKRHNQPRTLMRHVQGAEAAKIAKHLLNATENPLIFSNLDSEDWLHLVLLSAILFGGLNNTKSVGGFSKLLRSGAELQCHEFDGRRMYWVDFRVVGESVANLYMEKKPTLWRRWYADPVSLCFLARFNAETHKCPISHKEVVVLDGINRLLCKLDIPRWSTKSFNNIANSGSAVSEQLEHVDISVALVEVACGRTSTVSIPPEPWQKVLQQVYVVKDQYSISTINRKSGERQKRGNYISKNNLSQEYHLLTTALILNNKDLSKRTRFDALNELNSLDESEWSLAGRTLRSWYIHHLRDRKNSVSTARRYHTEVAKLWIYLSINNDYHDMDAGDWSDYYEHVLEDLTSPAGRAQRAGRFQDLHDFCVKEHAFLPTRVSNTEAEDDSPKYVNASYINYDLFQALVKAVYRIDSIGDSEKLNIELMVTFAYRLGMRVGEIVKLRLCDIDLSDECWVFTRENTYGDNKSTSSLRKIPVMALLSGAEWKKFSEYIANRRRYSNSLNEVLFHPDTNKYTPWEKYYISNIVGALLKDISGIAGFVFHGFRHTALSNLHLVIEQEWNVASSFMCLPQEQLKNIYKIIVGSDGEKLRRYWALACFAGHSDPSVTFHSYLHFSDLLIGLKLARAKHKLTRNQLVSMTGLSENRVTRLMRYYATDMQIFADVLSKSEAKKSDYRIDSRGGGENQSSNALLTGPELRGVSHDRAYKIIEEYQKGVAVEVIALKYSIDRIRLEHWLRNGHSLASMITREGNSRLISDFRNNSGQYDVVILPPPLRSRDEIHDADVLISRLRQYFKDNKKSKPSFLKLIEYYLKGITTSTSGILFTDPDLLLAFVSGFNAANIVAMERWSIGINAPKNGLNRKEWFAVENMKVKSVQVIRCHEKSTSAYLRLVHPSEGRIISGDNDFKKFSARTLRYVFHMIAIMQFDDELL